MKPSPNAAARGRALTPRVSRFAAAVLSLFVAGSGFGLAAPATPPSAAEDDSAAQARSALARAGAESRLEGIRDERLRRAAQTAYRALSEVAGNRDAAKTAALNARFERAYAIFAREAARAGLGNCAANCAADGDACRKACAAADKRSADKKLCGCKFAVFACVVAECLF